MGRPSKPTKLKVIEGNRGKRPLPKNEVEPGTAGAAKCPAHIKGIARAEWQRIAPELHRLGLLTMADRGTLEAYVTAYAGYRDALEHVQSEGAVQVTQTGYQQLSGWMSVLQKCRQEMIRYAAHFGMSPSSRAGLSVDKPAENPLEVMIRGSK